MTRLEYAAYNDIVFKNLFADKRNEDLLEAFLYAALDLPEGSIQKIEVKNGEITPLELSGKTCRLDLNLTVNNMLVNVEMQVAPSRDFADRALFYWSEIFLSGSEQGMEYGGLRKAITVNLLNYTMFNDDRFYREYVPADLRTGDVLSDKMQIKFFEMTKVPSVEERTEQDPIKAWLQLLKSTTK
ncbi:MAG: Rpn family recombination-promoting nuclease/putative transposase, partial [Clostridia bacterium]|nr:Rpn family recombination-promoting nuclease/putative transposase [Clostridia bacterium]